MRKIICAIFLVCFFTAMHAEGISVIPKPLHMEQREGCFNLTERTVISYEAGLKDQAEYLSKILSNSTGWDFQLKEGKSKGGIRLAMNDAGSLKPEGYQLEVSPREIIVNGKDKGGVFYGIQTLLQLFPAEVYSDLRQRRIDWKAPAVSITDAPERPWRGMMLDVARYFFNKEFVLKYIDMMAMYKLNKLQFHLIDDSGWRLEIKKYPLLTEVGAWAGPDAKRTGGYYTQEDIKEIISYAALRNVEVIPEIEFPAHILSAIVAYPWLGCTGLQHEVPQQHFISRDLLCVGKESSLKFLEDVLEETVNLFPSHYINIGGDEAVYSRWEECPHCQEVMKREGLKKAPELQGYLTNVVADMMKKKNRTVIGWEEIIQRGKVNNQVVALMWHTVKDSIQATNLGHKAILTPVTHLYLDMPESSTPGEIKAAGWMPPISLEKCYSMEINDYSPESTVLGVQGCLWSDQFIHGTVLQELPQLDENRAERYIEYLTFPRMLAVSELGWNRQLDRNYADFSSRIIHHYARLDNKNCYYRVPEPKIVSMEQKASGKLAFTLEPSVLGSGIRYTTNGSYPTIHSASYTTPVEVDKKSDFHAITVVTNSHYSLPIHFAPDYSAYKQYGTFTSEWKPLQIQTKMSPLRFECTGKISGNGAYEVTFIQTKGTNNTQLAQLRLFKRDEKLAEIQQEALIGKESESTTYRFTVDSFEAGTPFFIEVQAYGNGGNDTSGLIFIKKLDN